MSPQLEKVFINYILKNKKFFEIVKPYFFRNSEIQFVYGVIREYIIKGAQNVPSPRQILDMVSLEDKEGIITKEILKSILQFDLSNYSEIDFIQPKFNAWILSNRLKTGTVDIIDETRNLDSISDFEKAVEAADRIKAIVNEMSSTNFVQDDDLGSDFDDPESHLQDNSKFRVSCGFPTIDHMLGGGWDISTLNVIMAETSNGKCCLGSVELHIKNDEKDYSEYVKFETLFTKIGKKR